MLLGNQGRFREALEHLERGHKLGSQRRDWRPPSEGWVLDARRRVELLGTLPALLKGETRPWDAVERLELADLCRRMGRHAASARLADEAFADEAFAGTTTLADDLAKGYRYNAARSAALAGSGRGEDEPSPDEAGRARLREKALGWLRSDLAAWGKLSESGPAQAGSAMVRTLAHWKEDADLAGVRNETSLAKLPEPEREAFRRLWTDVEALSKKAKAGGH